MRCGATLTWDTCANDMYLEGFRFYVSEMSEEDNDIKEKMSEEDGLDCFDADAGMSMKDAWYAGWSDAEDCYNVFVGERELDEEE